MKKSKLFTTLGLTSAAVIGSLFAFSNANLAVGAYAKGESYSIVLSKETGNGVPSQTSYKKATGEVITIKTQLNNSINCYSSGFIKSTITTYSYVLQTNTTNSALLNNPCFYNTDPIHNIKSIIFNYSTKAAVNITVASGASSNELVESEIYPFDASSSYINDSFTYVPTSTANYFKLELDKGIGGTFYLRTVEIKYSC